MTGEPRDALRALRRAQPLAIDQGERANVVWTEQLLGDVTSILEPARARAHYERAITLARELALGPRLAASLSGLARLLRTNGRDSEADVLDEEAAALAAGQRERTSSPALLRRSQV